MNTKTYPEHIKKQGWEQMNSILEKEMPRRNKKRTLIFFFLFLGILSTAGIVFSKKYGIKNLDKPEPQQHEIKKNKLLQNSEPIASVNKHDVEIPLKPDNYRKKPGNNKLKNQLLAEYKENEIKHEQSNKNPMVYNQPGNRDNENSGNKHDKEYSNISKISSISNKELLLGQGYYLPGKTVMLYRKPVNKLFHPFIETKVYNKSSQKTNLGIEFCVGNTFVLSQRMYIDLAVGYADPGLLGKSVSLLQSFKTDAASSLNLGYTESAVKNTLSGGLIELSVFQGYRISRKLSIRGGGGISFTKLLSSKILYENSIAETVDSDIEFMDERNNTYRFSQNGLIPGYSFFAEANAGYKILKKLSLVAGYKHYFREYNVVTDTGKEAIYRVYFQQPDLISDFYLGLRYDFR